MDGFEGEDRAEQILRFRDALQGAIQEHACEDAVTFLGGATGLLLWISGLHCMGFTYRIGCGQRFLCSLQCGPGVLHVFRRDVGAVRLWEQEEAPEVDPETGSLLSAEDIETLESFDEGVSGYFGKMLRWLEDFIEQVCTGGEIHRRQAKQDLQIALWYSFACNNLDEYRYYYKAADWMKDSEKNAVGCAMWYYRYSVALMYCGQQDWKR